MALLKKLKQLLWAAPAVLITDIVVAESRYNMRRGVTDISNRVFDLHMAAIWVCVVIGIVVFGAMFYSMWAHRRSRNPDPATFSHSTKVEIVWTVIPFIILIALAWPAIGLLIEMEDTSEADVTILITGSQWKWDYKYIDGDSDESNDIAFTSSLISKRVGPESGEVPTDPNYLLEVDNRVVVPVGKKVRFLITASDVLHSWWMPDFAVKKDAIPGFINEAWARPMEVGTYRGQCTELCGKDHGFMPVVVDVVSDAEFDNWKVEQLAAKEEAARLAAEAAATSWSMEDLMAQGEEVYNVRCAACHKVDGTGIPGVFPSMIGTPITTGPIEPHLDIVVNGKQGSAMQAFGEQLTDLEIAAVITYERNAWGNNLGDLVQPADVAEYKNAGGDK